MKTLVCYSKENIKIKNTNVPVIRRDEVLIRTILCGLCGSDIVKIISPDIKKPVKLGHEVVGVVEKIGPEVNETENIREKISKFSSSGVDVVELTVTTPQTTRMAMDSVRPGGYIQIFAGPSTQQEISINFEHLYKKELTIFSSYSTTPEALKESFYFLKDDYSAKSRSRSKAIT